jgi:hypothetical protein
MRNTIFLFLTAFLLLSCSAKSTKITVENPLNFDRNGEIVEVVTTGLNADFSYKTYILRDEKGAEVGYQLLQATQVLVFQANVPAQSSVVYTLKEGMPAPVAVKTHARFVPERSDDFAWENDIAAYRMYGPALAKIEYPSNGIDIWMKYKDEPVMDSIYAGSLQKLSYHEDNGLGGFDCYDVNHTMGAGGIAPYTSQFWIGNAYNHYEIVESGPLRSVFTLIYDTIRIEDSYYEEILTITTDAGSLLNKGLVCYRGLDKPIKLATGIFMHGEKVNTSYDKENQVMTFVKNAVSNKGLPQGQTYISLYVPEAIGEPFEEDNHFAILSDYQIGNEFTYYFGGSWSKWKFPTENDWQKALIRFSQAKKEPLKIKIKN